MRPTNHSYFPHSYNWVCTFFVFSTDLSQANSKIEIGGMVGSSLVLSSSFVFQVRVSYTMVILILIWTIFIILRGEVKVIHISNFQQQAGIKYLPWLFCAELYLRDFEMGWRWVASESPVISRVVSFGSLVRGVSFPQFHACSCGSSVLSLSVQLPPPEILEETLSWRNYLHAFIS